MATLILTVEEANTYFETRMFSDKWDALPDSGDDKLKALTTAQNILSSEYDLASVEKHKNAVCEMALFLLDSGKAYFKRLQLQAQGVSEAGLVEEKYKQKLDQLIPANIASLVSDAYKGSAFGAYASIIDVERDENA